MTDDVTITLGGKRLEAWGKIEITRTLDACTTFSLDAPFDAARPELRELFRPFAFRRVEVDLDGVRIVTGTLVDIAPSTDAQGSSVSLSGYSLPGVLADTVMPASAYPLEFNGLTLTQIAQLVCGPYSLDVVSVPDVGAPFARVAIEPSASPLSFLSDLARQRGLVIGDDEHGRVRIYRADTSAPPVASFAAGTAPFSGLVAAFAPQSWASEMTALGPTSGRGRGKRSTARNPHARGVVRPMSYQPDDAEAGDLEAAASSAVARSIGNVATYRAQRLPGWRDPSGALWAPGVAVTAVDPGAMVYRRTRFTIRSVALTRDSDGHSAELELALPGSFGGAIPEVLPWDG